MTLVRQVGYGQAYSFKYSARPGTPAAERPCVPDDVSSERLHRLQALLTDQQRAAQVAMVGRDVNVLFEKQGRTAGQMTGKSDYLHAVHVTDPSVERGQIRRVRIIESNTNSLAGVLV